MPVQVITDDSTNTQIRFRTSAIYEMIVSLYTIVSERRHPQWARQVRKHLDSTFLEELHYLYVELDSWPEYLELAVDYPDHHDLSGFIDYLRNMPIVDFIFYIVGRRIPREIIAETEPTVEGIVDAIREHFGYYCEDKAPEDLPLAKILNDIDGFKNRLADLWQEFIDSYYVDMIPNIESFWHHGLDAHERLLMHKGGDALFKHLMGRDLKVPPPLPPGQPITEIVLIPLYRIPHRAFMFYGYGSITILYDCQYTEDRVEFLNKRRDEVVGTLRALSDPTRLHVLQLIARGKGKINGKWIAKHMDMSPSAVSRQLAQLREGNLIEEEPLDHRNISYKLRRETIEAIPEILLEYIDS